LIAVVRGALANSVIQFTWCSLSLRYHGRGTETTTVGDDPSSRPGTSPWLGPPASIFIAGRTIRRVPPSAPDFFWGFARIVRSALPV